MSECIEWTGRLYPSGYGARYDPEYKRDRGAHRMAWEEAHGLIPDGLCVLHACDNKPCVNVDHLFLGTKGDNNRDRHAKGRSRGGRGMPGGGRAILAESDIPVIRERRANGEYLKDIAASYGVALSTVGMITCGKTWTHVQ